jgi:hypothetical protein
MDKLDRLINIIRLLKEDGMVVGGPTNAANAAGLGYNPNTETPPVFPKRRKSAYLGIGSRKRWMQRRKPPQ